MKNSQSHTTNKSIALLCLLAFSLGSIAPFKSHANQRPDYGLGRITEENIIHMNRDELIGLIREKKAQIESLQKNLDHAQLTLYDNDKRRYILYDLASGVGSLFGTFALLQLVFRNMQINEASRLYGREHLQVVLTGYEGKGYTLFLGATVAIMLGLQAYARFAPPKVNIIELTEDEKNALEKSLKRLHRELQTLEKALSELRED